MAGRIRSIKPEILEDEKTAGLSHLEWRLFVSLWLIADDHGNLRADPTYVMGACLWASGESPEIVGESLETLRRLSLVSRYEVRGQAYLHITNWEKHQKISHRGKPRMPLPSEADHVSSGEPKTTPKTDANQGSKTEPPETLAKSSGDSPESLRPDLRPATSDPDPQGAGEGLRKSAPSYDPENPEQRGSLTKHTWSELHRLRAVIARELGLPDPVPPPPITPGTYPDGFRELSHRVREEGANAPRVCQHVLEARAFEARQTRDLEWLSEKTFLPGGWRTARERLPTWRKAAQQSAPRREIAYVNGREVVIG